uniref:Cadherin domain-containing protein n=1 Tax=Ascaris lumbricoides TaxID=6252 RepID=A0A0M3IRI8_ASCLU
LPSNTGSNRDGKFTIDKETGVITVTDYTLLQNDEYHLCAFARNTLFDTSPHRGINFSAYDLPAPPEIAFDNKNDSMIAFTVEVKSLKMAETLKGLPKIKFNNNTIITFGEEIYTPIPIRIDVNDELSPIKYHLNSVTFIPSESSSASTEKLDYFAVDPSSGDVRIDPALADHAEGVFSLHIDAMQKSTRTSIADLITSVINLSLLSIRKPSYIDLLRKRGTKFIMLNQNNDDFQVHNVKSSSMLKFIFDQEANLLSLNLDDFKTRLNSALNIDSSIAQISVVIGMPHSHSDSFKNRSSVCFHALRGDVILSQESAILALSATLNGDSTLSRLYQAFKVANIEPCFELERTLSSGIVVSRVTLFWIGVALLGLLILISFCLYS